MTKKKQVKVKIAEDQNSIKYAKKLLEQNKKKPDPIPSFSEWSKKYGSKGKDYARQEYEKLKEQYEKDAQDFVDSLKQNSTNINRNKEG